MTGVVIVADSGSVLADLTHAVSAVPGAYVARYGSARARLDLLVEQVQPELVVIGDLLRSSEALARLAEVRRAAPGAKVVMMSTSSSAGWLAEALRADASAVLPGSVPPAALALVLREVIAAPSEAGPPRERRTRPDARSHGRLPRRPRPLELHPHERAA